MPKVGSKEVPPSGHDVQSARYESRRGKEKTQPSSVVPMTLGVASAVAFADDEDNTA